MKSQSLVEINVLCAIYRLPPMTRQQKRKIRALLEIGEPIKFEYHK